MRKIIISILISIPFLSFAQIETSKDFTYKVGTPYRVIDAPSKNYFSEGNEVMSVKIFGKKVTIQKFNSETLEQISIKEYKDMPSGYVVEHLSSFNGKYYLFYSLWDKPNGNEQLFYKEIDFKTGEFIGDDQLIIKVNKKITGMPFGYISFWSVGVVDKFNFQYSNGDSKMVIQYRVKPEIRNDAKNYDLIGMHVFNENMQPEWNKEIKMPYTEKKMNNLDYSVDSEGNAYILSMVYNDNTTDSKKRKGDDPNYHIELLKFKAKTAELVKIPITLQDKFINGIWIYEKSDDYMVCAGFYNNGEDRGDADGIILCKIDKEGKTYDMASYEIPLEIINQNISERAQNKNERKDKKDKAEFQNIEMRDLLVQEDGSIILIGEQFYITQQTTRYGNSYVTTYTYHYEDILITKINPDGKLAWMKKLPKRQMGTNGRGGLSYEYIATNNSHYLLFLDNVKNMDLELNKRPAVHSDGKGGYLTAYKVNDKDGSVKKVSILDTRNVDGIAIKQFLTSRIVPVSNNDFVFEVYKGKKEDILIRVNFVE